MFLGSQGDKLMRERQFTSTRMHAKMLLRLLTHASASSTLCSQLIGLMLSTGPAIGTFNNRHRKEVRQTTNFSHAYHECHMFAV